MQEPSDIGAKRRESDASVERAAVSCKTIGLLTLQHFPMMAFSTFLEPFRAANRLTGARLYSWEVVGLSADPILASNGLTITPSLTIEADMPFHRVVVVSGGDADRVDSPASQKWLKRQAGQGAHIGGIADGAFFVARTGLMDGHSCSIHWESEHAFRERFPEVDTRPELFTIDRRRFSSAGGISAFDMALEILEAEQGNEIAATVSDWFVHDRARPIADRQAISLRARTGQSDPLVLAAIAEMEVNLEVPLAASELSRALGVSRPKLERRFRSATGSAPMRYYRLMRLRRARDMVRRTSMTIAEIAAATGFAHAARFSQTYRARFGLTPSEDRRRTRANVEPHLTLSQNLQQKE